RLVAESHGRGRRYRRGSGRPAQLRLERDLRYPRRHRRGPGEQAVSAPALPPLVYKEDPRRRRVRRAVDTVVASMLLTLAAPVLVAAGIAILIEDGGPIFFKQKRAGRFERLFVIYKLRTMRLAHCVDQPKGNDGTDPRVTRVGRILRKTSVD